jgi:hypothetical protein
MYEVAVGFIIEFSCCPDLDDIQTFFFSCSALNHMRNTSICLALIEKGLYEFLFHQYLSSILLLTKLLSEEIWNHLQSVSKS